MTIVDVTGQFDILTRAADDVTEGAVVVET